MAILVRILALLQSQSLFLAVTQTIELLAMKLRASFSKYLPSLRNPQLSRIIVLLVIVLLVNLAYYNVLNGS